MADDLDAVRAIYAEVDRLLDGWSCERSADCCHFGRTGREPQLWPNEWAVLRQALRAQPAPRPRRVPPIPPPRGARRLPVVAASDRDAAERRCPLLGADDRCVAYAARPFGCRTYFCDRAVGPTRRPPRAELATLGRALRDAAGGIAPSTSSRGGALAEAAAVRHVDGPRALTAWLATSGKRP